MSPGPADDLAAAGQTLAGVQAEVEAARALLLQLLQQAVEAESRLPDRRTARLVEVNEALVLAALRSQGEAANAALALDAALQSAELDTLTGLPNRSLLRERCARALAQARRQGSRLALLFLDLDRFKEINDRLGHAEGDAVLQRVAQGLVGAVRSVDTVCRYGGDEFVVLLHEISQAEDAQRVALKLADAIALATPAPPWVGALRSSIGISLYPDDGQDTEALIGQADAAMYAAKRRRTGGAGAQPPLAGTDPHRSSPAGASAEATGQALQDRRFALLREANERLLLAALSARALQDAAVRAQRRRTDMMAVVVDELLNPQAPIRLALAVLGRPGADSPLLPRVQSLVQRQARQIARLLGRQPGSAGPSSPLLALDWQRVDLAGLLREAAAACQPLLDARGQTLALDLGPAPQRIDGDPLRLAQAIGNLLDNASRHSHDGGAVTLSLLDQGDALQLTVADQGIGIGPLALPGIFEPFAQDPQALGLHGPGLGIGLTVVRALVEAHGGSVSAHSAGRGQGSRFVLRLPRARPA